MPIQPEWTKNKYARKLVSIQGSGVNPSFLGHVMISGVIASLALVSYLWTLKLIHDRAAEWDICEMITQPKPQQKTPSKRRFDIDQVEGNINALGNDNKASIIPSQKERLIQQLRQLDHAQRSACTLGIFFFAHRFSTYTIATGAGIATLAALAFVSKKGWENSNNAIINIGVTSGFILFSTLTFSQLYGQGSNYESQRIKQALASSQLNRLASASANRTAEVSIPASGNEKPEVLDLQTFPGLAQYIQSLDKELKILDTLDFGLDETFAKAAAARIQPWFGGQANQDLTPEEGTGTTKHSNN